MRITMVARTSRSDHRLVICDFLLLPASDKKQDGGFRGFLTAR